MTSIYLFFSLLWTAVWWFFSWSHIPLYSEYSFFPLWLGYIAVVNALCEAIYGDSLFRRAGWRFLWLFVFSIPLWWAFEYINSIVQNWHYEYRPISELRYFFQSSIDFSTVIPAVLSAAFLFYFFFKDMRWRSDQRTPSPALLILSIALGALSFAVMPLYPNEVFPLVWLAPLLILDPIAYGLGLPSIFGYMTSGDWRVPIATALASLCTGFFWEMWNFWSYPKWVYTIPYVGFWKIFEMPILGFGGYLPFGLIIFVYTVLIARIFFARQWHDIGFN